MRLSELFRSTATDRTDENGESVVVNQKNLNMLKLNRQIHALTPGQTIQGEVVSKKGGELQIKLADDLVLSARLEREIAIDIGKLMTFEVRNNGKSLTLSPLFANTATDVNVLKALEMANLPVNDVSVEMAQNMMERGMSIDKNSIQNVFRDVTANMDASVRDIVQLHQLNIEVTPQSLEQLKNYQAVQHQLTGAMNRIVEDFGACMEQSIFSENPGEALQLFAKLQAVFSEVVGATGSEDGQMQPVLTDGDVTGNIPEKPGMEANAQSSVQPGTAGNVTDGMFFSGMTISPEGASAEGANPLLGQLLSEEELQLLQEGLQRLSGSETDPKLQNLLQRLADGTATMADVREAVSSKDFAHMLKNQMAANWLLEPEMVQDKENMDKLYQRIGKQLGEMQKALSEMPGMEQSGLAKSVTNMQNNLDFMNQLNQTFTYVQIPLQMSGRETHGELYVYTNKKNLAREDGNVSAFLHLDMEHLGPVDVYVAMQNSKVNTKFYLKDDEMIDFISQHISILNERLAKRGYSMNCEMLKKEETEQETPILERMAEAENNVTVLGQYSFDVRA